MAETSKSKQKNKRQKTKPTAEENEAAVDLEDFLFGEGDKALEEFGKERGEAPSVADLVRGAISKEPTPGQDAASAAKGGVREQQEVAKVAWEDPQDLELQVDVARGKSQRRKLRKEESETTLTGNEYVERLRREHTRLHPQAKWSELPAARRARKRAARQAGEVDENEEEEEEDEEEEEEIDEDAAIRSAGNFVRESKTGPLPPGELEASRLKDANFVEPSKAVVRSVQFHANAQLMLTAGLDRTLRLFNIDGRRNDKVQGVHTEDMPIHQASFSGDGKQVIMSGRRKWFYIYDLPKGRCAISSCTPPNASLRSPREEVAVFIMREAPCVPSEHTGHWVGAPSVSRT
ncbi:hypothetical protein CYMTET_44701 [Cymbomonas tetramitiformis]|uniref:Uncharacterized protein n=1 Tax=Cymbomonas tetramitiformis TaxID=36881 RepID=A0AAE0C0W4_9CHLO|nr:hypothetical protein CYMTET_44701 [Cymbomonas tetramitiformis]